MAKRDPRRLRPAQVVRLLNSTPLGQVLTDRLLHRHRELAGHRIGDDTTVDLLRYTSWLVEQVERTHPQPQNTSAAGGYEAHKERQRQRQAEQAKRGMDIGSLPAVADPDRRARAEASFRVFCETYFPKAFYRPWSADLLRVIGKIERAVDGGGLFAMAMPRGGGKTTLCLRACLWGVLTGRVRYAAFVAATTPKAEKALAGLQTILETNRLLIEDFPEILVPVAKLERITQRQKGQTHNGEHTRIQWLSDMLVLPTVRIDEQFDQYRGPVDEDGYTITSGGVIGAAGLESGEIRGQFFELSNGEVLRPDLVMVDDPQTRGSAKSLTQTDERERIVMGDVLGMAGHDREISGLMACTVIYEGDLSCRFLDHEKHPDWQGERTKLVYVFPANEGLWEDYRDVRNRGLAGGDKGRAGNEFYAARHAICGLRMDKERPCKACPRRTGCMDADAVVAWHECFSKTELSAVQHAMNLKQRDEEVFFPEFQNEQAPRQEDDRVLTADDTVKRVNGRRRGEVPQDCQYVTAFVDLHANVHYYAVCAWRENFTGYVIDYGTFPDQGRRDFTQRSVRKTLGRTFKGAGVEGAMLAGLEQIGGELLARDWPKAGGGLIKISKLLVDQGYKRDVAAAAKHKLGAIVELSKGVGIKAAGKPISSYQRKPGERYGQEWYYPNVSRTREFPHVVVDVNFWKTFLHERFGTAPGDAGSLTLFGNRPEDHRLIAEHVAESETWTLTHGHGRDIREWKLKPARPDNHWLDCLVGCCAAASILGCRLGGVETPPAKQRKRYTQADLRRRS
ncbi:MAG: phage terminase large subunit family protein [Planctomycetes bacterium]|nr:phage terminase large subunit family protein [Planctomycetota bacterium]